MAPAAYARWRYRSRNLGLLKPGTWRRGAACWRPWAARLAITVQLTSLDHWLADIRHRSIRYDALQRRQTSSSSPTNRDITDGVRHPRKLRVLARYGGQV